jgi:hypothetical protein
VEVDALLADLPAPASAFPAVGEVVGERTSGAVGSVFGDIKLSATTAVPDEASTVFGDVEIGLT